MSGRRSSKQRGASRLGILLTILFLICGAYAGAQVIPFYYYYYELKGLMEAQAAKASVFTDAKIRKNLLKKIEELEIPVNHDDDLKINRFNDKITIDLEYQEVLYVDLGEDRVYDVYVFRFNPRVERAY